ncbi:MAG: hypothetical protein ABJ205_13945 [Erythrobacter sp.]|uniref:hypothetical protein n=1 Tax=Erythrobacter sp. TaxID=1042 RepID=UPI0032669D6A
MSSLYAFAASAALFLPFLGQANDAPASFPAISASQCSIGDTLSVSSSEPLDRSAHHSEPPASGLPLPIAAEGQASTPLEAFYATRTVNQVRIERRVTIRIAPLRQSSRNSLLAQLPRRGVTRTYEERKMNGCIPVAGIAGVQTGTGNRLLLFLRDERIIGLNLERGCEARDFYSGFYVERNDDGRLCVKRDQLQSRSGAKCEVERMRHLVVTED